MDGGSEGVPEGLYILERLASNALHSYMKSFRTSFISPNHVAIHPWAKNFLSSPISSPTMVFHSCQLSAL